MADVSKSSSFDEDPLKAYSGLSLFPRTLKSLSNPLPPPGYQSEDLQQTHAFLESMPFEVRNEHQEQAKAILEDANAGVKMNIIPRKRERRPGLDRKRKEFSLNFTKSQSSPVPPSFDGSKYPNPEDYFAEYDKFENANREWHKQTGSSVIDTQPNPRSRRPRRPGIPGRERGSYKHTYTDSFFTDAKNLEALEKESSLPSEQSLERTTAAHVTTADREVDDTNVDTDKDLKNILSELLACNQDELEGDGAVKLLEDRLKIKSFDVEKLSIPEFPDVRKMDLKASGRNPSKPKSVLSDIQNMLKGIHRDRVRNYSCSPSPLTKKHFSSPHPPEDQFSFPDVHNLLPGDQQPSKVDVQPLAKDLNICSSSSVTKDADKSTVDGASHLNSSVEESSSEDDCSTHSVEDAIKNRNSVTLEVNVDVQAKGKEEDVPMTESGANGNTDRRENDTGIDEETDQSEKLAEYESREVTRQLAVEEDSIPHQPAASSKSPNRAPKQYNTLDGSFEHAEHTEGQQWEENENGDITSGLEVENAQTARTKPTARKSTGGKSPRKQLATKQKEQTKKRRKEESSDSNVTKRSKSVHGEIGLNEQIETLPHESGAKKQTEKRTNEREEKPKKTVTRENKMFSERKSLAGAGTKVEGGVRRSTRIKSRPLEYWRGERFLYGRIHKSLATVIGIKYGSPGDTKGDKRATKVKSFVSDEYKELLDFAAMH